MNKLALVCALGTTLMLSACDQTKTALGLNRNVNDEFAVLTTPPLTLPPNFNELPSPVTKEASNTSNEAKQKAENAALSQFSHSVAYETKAPTGAEAHLLKNAKADSNDPNIRQNLSKENTKVREKNKSFIKDMFGITDKESSQELDPFEEKTRLEQAKSLLE